MEFFILLFIVIGVIAALTNAHSDNGANLQDDASGLNGWENDTLFNDDDDLHFNPINSWYSGNIYHIDPFEDDYMNDNDPFD